MKLNNPTHGALPTPNLSIEPKTSSHAAGYKFAAWQTQWLRMFYLLLALAAISSAHAADPEIYAHAKKGAVKGTDVVAYFSLQPGDKAVRGSDAHTHRWRGATWKFSSAENRDRFAANPEAYAPQFGGYCAFAVSHNFTKPVNPNKWAIVDGKLYLNLNGIAQRKWNKDRAAAIARGHANWPAVLESCETHGNCRD